MFVAALPIAAFGADTDVSARFSNFSSLGSVDAGRPVLIKEFSITGDASKRVLLRAVGSPLGKFFGAGAFLDNPAFELWRRDGIREAGIVVTNDDWDSDNPELREAMEQVGALPLPAGGHDAAAIATLPPGNYQLVVHSSNATTGGFVLTEAFDLEPKDGRLVGLSVRGGVSAGGSLVSGFVVSGDRPVTVLARAIGPKLADFGVTAPLGDPQLQIYTSSGLKIAANDDWISRDDDLAAALTRAGDTPLVPGSKDAALLVTLAPGAYTAVVTGAAGGSGNTLLEIGAADTSPPADGTLTIDKFTVEMSQIPSGFYYQPYIRVVETSGKSAVRVKSIVFRLEQVPGLNYAPNPLPRTVAAGETKDLLNIVYFEPEITLSSRIASPFISLTVVYLDAEQHEHSVSAMAQVAPNP